MRVLVDTSVWVDHFRAGNATLAALLGSDRVLVHPLVLGEIACGTPPSRERTLRDLGRLQPAPQATLREVLGFVEQHRLFGLGCGFIDINLLASTLLTPGVEVWTLDKRFGALAERFGVLHCPTLH